MTEWEGTLIWECKIGSRKIGHLPKGSDWPMRLAISKAYQEITGEIPEFIFSGWNASLTQTEMDVLDDNKTP